MAEDVVSLSREEVSRIRIPTGEAHKGFSALWGGGAIRAPSRMSMPVSEVWPVSIRRGGVWRVRKRGRAFVGLVGAVEVLSVGIRQESIPARSRISLIVWGFSGSCA